jgi:hypothetical protein
MNYGNDTHGLRKDIDAVTHVDDLYCSPNIVRVIK